MTAKYKRLYRKLKVFGFSPSKALEVLFDAKRGDRNALLVCRTVAKAC